MEKLLKMDDFGGTPIFGNTHIQLILFSCSRDLIILFCQSNVCMHNLRYILVSHVNVHKMSIHIKDSV